MPITHPSSLRPGTAVSIVLKADQRTGRQVQGTIAQLLTRHNHPRGIKVKLTDGRVGRVQQIVSNTLIQSPLNDMSHSNNPWAAEQSHGNPQHQQHHHRPDHNDDPLANDPNRGEQFERMQAYEASAPQSEDDRNQAQLQKEFPNIDGSLIAAIYNERGGAGLGEVREMLQELNQV
ncbi:hypothetical protein DV736_g2979, partial [Chaetothyriales sp. CBS 134916]